MQTRSQPYRPALVAAVMVVLLVLLIVARFPPGPAGASPSASASTATATDASAAASGSLLASGSPTSSAIESPTEAVLLAAGDIASCDVTADKLVAELAGRLSGTIALLGDLAYPHGSAGDYANCFDPDWGGLRDRLRPAPGNHEYETRGAAGYFAYFGAAAGTPGQGWYAYDLGAWHVISLNSECGAIQGGCEGQDSAELAWLVADLAAHPAACTLAYWHHPRWSSGLHGTNEMTDAFWDALAAAGADIVLSGHDHDYERMEPIDGVRAFVVGTGGRSLYDWPGSPLPQTAVRANDTYGLLELTLRAADYSWRFVPASGSFTDSGSATCR